MEEIWEVLHDSSDERYEPKVGEYFIRIQAKKNTTIIYIKKEGKINYHFQDFMNFLWYNFGKLQKGDTVSYLQYWSPLKQSLQHEIKVNL